MLRKKLVLLMALVALLLLVACQPNGSEVDVTPEVTLPAAPTAAATDEPTATVEVATATTEPTAAATVEATATATTEATTAPDTVEGFIDQMKLAIAAGDATALEAMMADPFTIGYWLSEGVEMSAAEAAQQVIDLAPADPALRWATADLDLAPLLMGQPPATFLGPDKQVAATVLSAGWGEDGAGEAIHFITQQPDGGYRWELMLFSGFGFAAPTDAVSVLINSDEATFYSGPGTSYEPVATVFGGQSYPVLGVSDDGLWWRLLCYDDANEWIASCWVSADPAVTTPAMP
jgi:hypothetical protein